MYPILHRRNLNDSVVLMEIQNKDIAVKAKAGQFIVLRIDEKGERIPLTIADTNVETGAVTIIFQVAGATTRRLATLQEGDSLMDFVGPLGMPTHLEGAKKIVVVGGGVGCAIAFPQAKQAFKMGAEVDVIAGFRNKDIVILEDEFKQNSTNLFITTDDGSYGYKGFVTQKLEELIQAGNEYDLCVAIGPVPMMKFISQVTKKYNIKTWVSLNPIMIDATGMCGCCRVTVDGKTRFACVEGPDFDGHLVDFDELMLRNRFYRETEQAKDHACMIGLEDKRDA